MGAITLHFGGLLRIARLLTVAVMAGSLAAVSGCTAAPPAAVVSILSDSHAFNADSWWRQTVAAGKVPGMTMGAFESHPGAGAAALAKRLDAAAAKKGIVIIQAGTNDLLSGTSPADTAAGVEALWKGIKDRGATPVVALVPPSNTVGANVVELNNILSSDATKQRMDVIDVYAPVANPDGTWQNGMTTDGTHANKAGSDLMTAAAMKQLPSLVD